MLFELNKCDKLLLCTKPKQSSVDTIDDIGNKNIEYINTIIEKRTIIASDCAVKGGH